MPTTSYFRTGTDARDRAFRRSSSSLGALLVALLLIAAVPTHASEIFVLEKSFNGSALESELTGLGHTVTRSTSLPVDLSPFDTIWVLALAALTVGEQTQLTAFVTAGGGLHLTGERPCCEPQNDSNEAIVNALVVGGGVTVGDQGDISGPYPFNPAALGGITSTPNALATFTPIASGGIAGIGSLPDENILATGAGGVPVGAVWGPADLGGGGAITLLMDVNWASSISAEEVDMIENIQTFLEDPPAAVTFALLGSTKLVVHHTDPDPLSNRIIVVLRDGTITAPTPLGDNDPTIHGATLNVGNPNTATGVSIDLPAQHWHGRGSPAGSKGYVYRDLDFADGPCRVAKIIPGKVVKANCGGRGVAAFGPTLATGPQGEMSATLSLVDEGYCGGWSGDSIRVDRKPEPARPGLFRAKNGPAPTSCNEP
jgi:hypothetical protein